MEYGSDVAEQYLENHILNQDGSSEDNHHARVLYIYNV